MSHDTESTTHPATRLDDDDPVPGQDKTPLTIPRCCLRALRAQMQTSLPIAAVNRRVHTSHTTLCRAAVRVGRAELALPSTNPS